MRPSTVAFAASALFSAAVSTSDPGFWIKNENTHPVFISFDVSSGAAPADIWLDSQWSQWVPTNKGWSGAFYVSTTRTDRAVGAKRNADTKVEATFQGANDLTYFDVDIEKGFSLPVWCGPRAWNVASGCSYDFLSDCPQGDRHYDQFTGEYDQCRNPQSAESIVRFRSHCPSAYVQWNDVQTKASTNNILNCYVQDTPGRNHKRSVDTSDMAGRVGVSFAA
ncbi:hypothetical protein B0A49_13163 [Cryomyces minteri]|uniref:Uncharacterized protein n=1 Tax=Cryomyces minteri TaxID=331657 RepID=A0A4U0VY55_9PEZI|nr:hypothetical protein B0A49_13163 [Cryomyces minteri]